MFNLFQLPTFVYPTSHVLWTPTPTNNVWKESHAKTKNEGCFDIHGYWSCLLPDAARRGGGCFSGNMARGSHKKSWGGGNHKTRVSGRRRKEPSPAGERRPLYRLCKSDVVEIKFVFSPEFNQSVSVQPDGFVTLQGIEELYAEGMTLPQFREAIRGLYRAACCMIRSSRLPSKTSISRIHCQRRSDATGQVRATR